MPDILTMNKLQCLPNQIIILSFSTSLVEGIKFRTIDFSRNSLQTGEGCFKLKKKMDKVEVRAV